MTKSEPGLYNRYVINKDNNDTPDYEKLLSDPFEADDIEWRAQASGIKNSGKPWVRAIPYVTNRAVQQRLDDVFGVFGWEDVYRETQSGKGMLCGIKVFNGEYWVTKWDGAEIPQPNKNDFIKIDPMKTALSNSEKRTGVKLSIGRYLYNLKEEYPVCRAISDRWSVSEKGEYIKIKQHTGFKDKKTTREVHAEWFKPELPEWALPSVKPEILIKAMGQAEDLPSLKEAHRNAYNYAKSFQRGALLKRITETKDKQKLKLENESKNKTSDMEQDIRIWLEKIVTNHIFDAANESVLILAQQKILKDLQRYSKDAGIDPTNLEKTLKKYYQKRLSELQPGEKHE
jgi:hypothetical protein